MRMAKKTTRQETTETRSGRWTLAKKGTRAELSYEPPKSEERVSFELSAQQLTEVRKLAKKADAAGVRDLVLTPEARAEALRSSGVSSVVAANTWRWALPLFGGPKPPEQSRPHGPRFGRRKF